MNKLKSVFDAAMECIKHYPVEALLGVSVFVLSITGYDYSSHVDYANLSYDVRGVQYLFFPLFVLTYMLHRCCVKRGVWGKILYGMSYFAFVPLLFIDLSTFLWSFAHGFTWLLAALVLIIGEHKWDNRQFANGTVEVITQVFFSFLIGGLVYVAFLAIWKSLTYIFDWREDFEWFAYAAYFILFILIPLLFCSFMGGQEQKEKPLPQILGIILNFVLSPAIIIYTAILYIYFIDIIIRWNLPKGGLGYMVMAFIIVALLGLVVQEILSRRYYDWFYGHFTWISIPVLAMFWVGTVYRISLYSLTESRVYLLVAGVLMTLFVLMLLSERTRRFRNMVLIACCAIVLFTYIPGISAKKIGVYAQTARFEGLAAQLGIIDRQTHKLVKTFDYDQISDNRHLSRQYGDMADVYNYLVDNEGRKAVERQFGKLNYQPEEVDTVAIKTVTDAHQYTVSWRSKSFDVGEYTVCKKVGANPDVRCMTGYITVCDEDGDTLLLYPVDKILKVHPELVKRAKHDPACLLTYRNDSVLLIIRSMTLEMKNKTFAVDETSGNEMILFKRTPGNPQNHKK